MWKALGGCLGQVTMGAEQVPRVAGHAEWGLGWRAEDSIWPVGSRSGPVARGSTSGILVGQVGPYFRDWLLSTASVEGPVRGSQGPG